MCKFKSGIITKSGITLAPMYNDSHSMLLESMGIADTQVNAMRVFVRAELIPPDNDKTIDVKRWAYIVDQDVVPDWYEEDSKRYEMEMREAVEEWMKEHFTVICGKFCVKLKEDKNGTYYMLADTLFRTQFGKDNNYSTSDVRKLLQECDFAKRLQKEYGDKLVPITTNLLSMDGLDDYGIVDGDILALRTLDLHRECRKNIPNNDEWEWLATPYSTKSNDYRSYVCIVGGGGAVNFSSCDYGLGVRPFFIFKS